MQAIKVNEANIDYSHIDQIEGETSCGTRTGSSGGWRV